MTERAIEAGTAALAASSGKFDTLRDLVALVVDSAYAAEPPRGSRVDVKELRRSFLLAIIAQLRADAAAGVASEKGFYDAELTRAADYLETWL